MLEELWVKEEFDFVKAKDGTILWYEDGNVAHSGIVLSSFLDVQGNDCSEYYTIFYNLKTIPVSPEIDDSEIITLPDRELYRSEEECYKGIIFDLECHLDGAKSKLKECLERKKS